MVDHDVIDPVLGSGRWVAGDRREADDLTVGVDDPRRVLEIVAEKSHIASRERPSGTRHPRALFGLQFEQHHRARIGAIDFNEPDHEFILPSRGGRAGRLSSGCAPISPAIANNLPVATENLVRDDGVR